MRCSKQRDTIQIPHLHTTLVEVHQELAKTSQATKDMADIQTTKASELMKKEWLTATQSNTELTIRLQQVESKLKEVEERLQTYEHAIVPILDRQLWEELKEMEDIID